MIFKKSQNFIATNKTFRKFYNNVIIIDQWNTE